MKWTIYDLRILARDQSCGSFPALSYPGDFSHPRYRGQGVNISPEWRPYVWLAPRLDWCGPTFCCLSRAQQINWRLFVLFSTMVTWEQPPRHAYCPANCCHKFWTQLAGKHSFGKLLYSNAGENGIRVVDVLLPKGCLRIAGRLSN